MQINCRIFCKNFASHSLWYSLVVLLRVILLLLQLSSSPLMRKKILEKWLHTFSNTYCALRCQYNEQLEMPQSSLNEFSTSQCGSDCSIWFSKESPLLYCSTHWWKDLDSRVRWSQTPILTFYLFFCRCFNQCKSYFIVFSLVSCDSDGWAASSISYSFIKHKQLLVKPVAI